MKPSEVMPEADFYGESNDGLVFIVKRVPENSLADLLYFWIVNQNKKPIQLNYIVDQMAYYVEDKKYLIDKAAKITNYPDYINPHNYVLIKAWISKEKVNSVTAVSFKIGLKRKEYLIPRRK